MYRDCATNLYMPSFWSGFPSCGKTATRLLRGEMNPSRSLADSRRPPSSHAIEAEIAGLDHRAAAECCVTLKRVKQCHWNLNCTHDAERVCSKSQSRRWTEFFFRKRNIADKTNLTVVPIELGRKGNTSPLVKVWQLSCAAAGGQHHCITAKHQYVQQR